MEPAALTPREILGLLAEEDRLRVVSALVLGATTSAEVAAATGMTVRETGRALARLAAGGLVESGPDGYRLRAEALREMAMADARPEPGPPRTPSCSDASSVLTGSPRSLWLSARAWCSSCTSPICSTPAAATPTPR